MTFIFQGNNLNNGASTEDYTVNIGDGLCTETEVTEYDIVCFPPEEQPQSLLDREYPEVVVSKVS